ncbi:Uma2 family endonuclease [soil metagenome]
MSARQLPRLTERQYLDIEHAAEFKSEFYQGRMYAMGGASRFHNRIQQNLNRRIEVALDDTCCQSFPSDMRVKIGKESLYTYLDLIVVCGTPEFAENSFDTLLNPKVIIEVVSPSTEQRDKIAKFEHYIQLETVKEYLLVSQDQPRVQRYSRKDDGQWLISIYDSLVQVIEFSSIPVQLKLADIYARVTFDEDGPQLR